MTAVKGKSFRIYVDDGSTDLVTAIGNTSSDNLGMSKDIKGNSHKDSDGWVQNTQGQKSWQMSSEQFFEENGAAFLKLEDSFLNDKTVKVEFRNAQDRIKRVGTGIVTQINISGANEDDAGNSLTIVGTGRLDKSTY